MGVSVPLGGFRNEALPLPAHDFSGAQEITLAAGVEQQIDLPAGVYQVICKDVAFDFAHAADLSDISIRAPWFAGVWLSLFLNQPSKLALVSVDGGNALILPAISA